jgi:solute carrier family 19 (thiamine transporter), member 2/3
MQTLWQEIAPAQGNSDVYNGEVTAAATFAGICVTLVCANVSMTWPNAGELVLGVLSLLECLVLLVASQTGNIWIAYAMYVVFAAVYTLLITIITAEVAKAMKQENYAFVFGFNMLFALALQSVLTLVVNNDTLNIAIRVQFLIYGGFFGIVALIFIGYATSHWCCISRHRQNHPPSDDDTLVSFS